VYVWNSTSADFGAVNLTRHSGTKYFYKNFRLYRGILPRQKGVVCVRTVLAREHRLTRRITRIGEYYDWNYNDQRILELARTPLYGTTILMTGGR